MKKQFFSSEVAHYIKLQIIHEIWVHIQVSHNNCLIIQKGFSIRKEEKKINWKNLNYYLPKNYGLFFVNTAYLVDLHSKLKQMDIDI